MIQYSCQKCGTYMESPDEMVAKEEVCPSCSENNLVPVDRKEKEKYLRQISEQISEQILTIPKAQNDGPFSGLSNLIVDILKNRLQNIVDSADCILNNMNSLNDVELKNSLDNIEKKIKEATAQATVATAEVAGNKMNDSQYNSKNGCLIPAIGIIAAMWYVVNVVCKSVG